MVTDVVLTNKLVDLLARARERGRESDQWQDNGGHT